MERSQSGTVEILSRWSCWGGDWLRAAAIVLLCALTTARAAQAGAPAAPPAQAPIVVPGRPLLPDSSPLSRGKSPSAAGSPVETEEAARPFVPSRPRSEAEQDHLTALAYYSAGRMAEQRQEFASALRNYERAHRYDP